MQSFKPWLSRIIIGLSVLFGFWLLWVFMRTGSHTDVAGYPVSVIVPGVWFIVLSLGWSITCLTNATGALRIPRTLSVLAAGLSAVGMLLLSITMLDPQANSSRTSSISVWLIPLAIIISQVASLVESGWGKTNRQAWLRVIGAACIGATLLTVFLIAWSLWFSSLPK